MLFRSALGIRREAWEAVGPLDVRYRFYAQDLDFCLSLRDAGWRVAVATGFRVMHLGGATIAQRVAPPRAPTRLSCGPIC